MQLFNLYKMKSFSSYLQAIIMIKITGAPFSTTVTSSNVKWLL